MVEQTFTNSIHGLSRSSSLYLEKHADDPNEQKEEMFKQLDYTVTPTASPNKENYCGITNNANFFACKLKENLNNINNKKSGPLFLIGGDDLEDEDQFKDLNEKDITNMPTNMVTSAPIEMKPKIYEEQVDDASYLSSTLKETSLMTCFINSSSSGSNKTEISGSSGSDSCVNISADSSNLGTKINKNKNQRKRRQQQRQKQKELIITEEPNKNDAIKSFNSSSSPAQTIKNQMSYSDVVQTKRRQNDKKPIRKNESDEINLNDLKLEQTSNCKYKPDHLVIKEDVSDFTNQSNKKGHLLNNNNTIQDNKLLNYYYDYEEVDNDLEFYLDNEFETAKNGFYIHSSNNSLNKQNDFEFDTNDEDSSMDYFLASSVDTVINAPFLRAAMLSAAKAVKVKSISNNNLTVSSSVGHNMKTTASNSMIHTTSSSMSINSTGNYYLLEKLNDNNANSNKTVDCMNRMSSNPNLNYSEFPINKSPINKSTEFVQTKSNEKHPNQSRPVQLINNLAANTKTGAIFMVNFNGTTNNIKQTNCRNTPPATTTPTDIMTPNRMENQILEQKIDSIMLNESEKSISTNDDYLFDKQKQNIKFRKANFDKKVKQTTKSLSANSTLNNYQTKMDVNKDQRIISTNNGNDGNNTYSYNNSNNRRTKNNKSNKFYKYQYQQQQPANSSNSAPNSTKNSTVLNNNDYSSSYKSNNVKQKFKINNSSINNNNNKSK